MSQRVAIIIATYNRATLLDECLHHLGESRFQAGDEVIVVDNGSTDDTRAVIERHRRRYPVTLRYAYEPEPGKSHALARAVGMAAGDILAFIDDDVNVDAVWLDEVRKTLAREDVALMGGRVTARWEPAVPQWMRAAAARHARLAAPLALLDYPPAVVELGPRTVLGANLAVRRDVLNQVGGFATHVGKLRGTLLSGEDHDLCLRVQRAGLRAIYVPSAVVRHWVPAERARVGYFLKWFYWSGITNAILDRAHEQRGRRLGGLPLYLVKRSAIAAAQAVCALALGRRATALERAVDCAFATGYAAARWGLVAPPLRPVPPARRSLGEGGKLGVQA
jgi:GT2 family glycosyltransferase